MNGIPVSAADIHDVIALVRATHHNDELAAGAVVLGKSTEDIVRMTGVLAALCARITEALVEAWGGVERIDDVFDYYETLATLFAEGGGIDGR